MDGMTASSFPENILDLHAIEAELIACGCHRFPHGTHGTNFNHGAVLCRWVKNEADSLKKSNSIKPT
jgi:hypothetical protein